MVAKFPGFSMPKDTYLPPEFWDVMKQLRTGGEIKVLLVVLREYFRSGLDAQPLPVARIQELSGLARKSVTDALQKARVRGTIIRRRIGRTYGYEPRLCEASQSSDSEPSCMHDSLSSPSSSGSSPDHDHDHALRLQILKTLVAEFAVSVRVAEDIARGRDPSYVLRQIEYARFEVEKGFTPKNSAGYMVARIRDDRPAPLGFQQEPKKEARWYTDEEFELFFEH
jgi:hypothetical protein